MVADAVKLVPPLGVQQYGSTGLSVVQNPAASFTIHLPSSVETDVLFYNLAGRKVSSITGTGLVQWTPADLPCGVYFAVESNRLQSIKLVYIR